MWFGGMRRQNPDDQRTDDIGMQHSPGGWQNPPNPFSLVVKLPHPQIPPKSQIWFFSLSVCIFGSPSPR